MGSKRPGHLHQNRHGVYYFRRAILDTIKAHFAQREIYRSLQTTCRPDTVVQKSNASPPLRLTG